jgi:hypothetical protein
MKIVRTLGSVLIGIAVLSFIPRAVNSQQPAAGSGNGSTQSQPPNSGATPDPNMPGRTGTGNGFLWTYLPNFLRVTGLNPAAPVVCFLSELKCGAQEESNYLGFIDGEGSLIEDRRGDHAVSIYNGPAHTIKKKYQTVDDIPADVFASLRNREFVFNSVNDRSGPPRPQKSSPGGAARFAAKNQVPDPNLPPDQGNDSITGFPLGWTLVGGTTQPVTVVRLSGTAGGTGLYLGFNGRGSWIVSLGNAKVYIWNLASKTMVEGADNWWLAPVDLSNPSPLMQAIVYYDANEDIRSAGSGNGPARDPNLPPSLDENAQAQLPVRWTYMDGGGHVRTIPLVSISLWTPWNGVGGVNTGSSGDLGSYLGFNERGSWIEDGLDGRIYAWDFKTLSVTLLASRLNNIPRDELASLLNPSQKVLDRLVGKN